MSIGYTYQELKNEPSILDNIYKGDKISIICDFCGTTFKTIKSDLTKKFKRGDNTILCSMACYRSKRGTATNVPCTNCGTEVSRRLSEINGVKNSFCSSSCAATYNNTHKTKGNRRSKLEEYLEVKLNEFYPNLIVLPNDKTAINHELDIYLPQLKLAFELNGIFHYEPIYGDEKLSQIQTNDNNKFQKCQQHGISLCVIDTTKQKRFTVESSQQFLKIITDIIKTYNIEEIKREHSVYDYISCGCTKCGKTFKRYTLKDHSINEFCSNKCKQSYYNPRKPVDLSKLSDDDPYPNQRHGVKKIVSTVLQKAVDDVTVGDVDKVKEMFIGMINSGVSPTDINKKFDLGYVTFADILNKLFGITLLSRKEAIKHATQKKGVNSKERFKYSRLCLNQSKEKDLKKIEGYEDYMKFGKHSKDNPNGLIRGRLYSIDDGFNNNVDVKVIRHPANLKYMTMEEFNNTLNKSSITLEELYKRIDDW